MAQNQQHGDQSIGGGSTQDGIQGTPPGTEGATSGQGIAQGQSKQSTQGTNKQQGGQQGNRQGNQQVTRQASGGTETYQRNDLFEDQDEDAGLSEQQRADSQQSAQREGMGSHQHTERGNRQGSDVEQDDEDFGNLHSDKDPNRER